MTKELEKKVAQAIRLLKATAPKDGSPVDVLYNLFRKGFTLQAIATTLGRTFNSVHRHIQIIKAK